MKHVPIVVLDFGSQYTQIIARKLRESGVYSEIVPYNESIQDIMARTPKGLILSGGPASVYAKDAYHPDATIFDLGLPILGICRGMQLMNIYKGGTLHKDIKAFYTETPHITTLLPKKTVYITKDSLLHKILKHERYRVNSLHHQSIDRLGDGIEIVAKEENGIIQAIEGKNHPFYIGLQWHPEYLLQFRPQRALFHELVKKAKALI